MQMDVTNCVLNAVIVLLVCEYRLMVKPSQGVPTVSRLLP